MLKTHLERQGFAVHLSGRVRGQLETAANGKQTLVFKEKGVDVIAVDMVRHACDGSAAMLILGSSDSDLQPAIAEATRRGLTCVYLGFENGPEPRLGLHHPAHHPDPQRRGARVRRRHAVRVSAHRFPRLPCSPIGLPCPSTLPDLTTWGPPHAQAQGAPELRWVDRSARGDQEARPGHGYQLELELVAALQEPSPTTVPAQVAKRGPGRPRKVPTAIALPPNLRARGGRRKAASGKAGSCTGGTARAAHGGAGPCSCYWTEAFRLQQTKEFRREHKG